MNRTRYALAAFVLAIVPGSYLALAQQPQNASLPHAMTFFITSVGMGKGANLGGLAGADAHCQTLATAVGAGSHTWHAYLSTQAKDGQPAVNARDRIGQGPWYNAKGEMIARDLAQLAWRHARSRAHGQQRQQVDGADGKGRNRAGSE